jgi:hypothetical protein
MNAADEAIFSAIREADKLRARTRTKPTVQVKGAERDIIRATALAWFNNHRKQLTTIFTAADLAGADDLYKELIEASHRSALRSKHVDLLKKVRDELVRLRSTNVLKLSSPPPVIATADTPPNFALLIKDADMKTILERRWIECIRCIAADAPLAAVVMMGGLLEALILARINALRDKSSVFTAKAAPKDKGGKTLLLKEWTLQHYIEVAHELRWITHAAREISVVLRDYRNYIHPQKEHSHGVSLRAGDAQLLWEISKSISRQIIA